MDIVEFIKKLQIRPGMYIGDLNFTNLKHYIDGFIINNFFHNRDYINDKKFKNEFTDYSIKYIYNKYDGDLILSDIDKNSSKGYDYFIMSVELEEEKRIKLFFEIFDSFFELN